MSDRKFIVLINSASGSQENDLLLEAIRKQIDGERLENTIRLMPSEDFEAQIDKAIVEAEQSESVLLVAGGDGTINTVLARASVAAATIALAFIPRGTFNYFARDHGIPLDMHAAIDLAISGEIESVPLCWVNQEPFCVSACLGVYPKIIETRERLLNKIGRSRIVAFMTSIWIFMTEQKRTLIAIERGDQVRQFKTPLVVVSCSQTQLETFNLPEATRLKDGYMIYFAMRGRTNFKMLFALLRSAFGNMKRVEEISYEPVESFQISFPRITGTRKIKVAIDGEVRKLDNPLKFRVQHDAAKVIVPPRQQDSE